MRVRYSFSSRKTGRIDVTNVHKKPVPEIVKEVVGMSDIVLEIIDARFIEETRNAEIEKMIIDAGKKIIYILNKADLVDIDLVKKNRILRRIKPYIFFSCRDKIGRANLRILLKIEAKRLKKEGNVLIGVIGYPNTGKSSIINILSAKKAAGVAAESGFTKGIQKIRLGEGVMLLDSPGVMPEYEAPAHKKSHFRKLSIIGVKTWDKIKEPEFIVSELIKEYPNLVEEFYGVDAKGDSEILIEKLGRKHKFITRGNVVDIDRTARLILRDWQLGKIRVKKEHGEIK